MSSNTIGQWVALGTIGVISIGTLLVGTMYPELLSPTQPEEEVPNLVDNSETLLPLVADEIPIFDIDLIEEIRDKDDDDDDEDTKKKNKKNNKTKTKKEEKSGSKKSKKTVKKEIFDDPL